MSVSTAYAKNWGAQPGPPGGAWPPPETGVAPVGSSEREDDSAPIATASVPRRGTE